MKPYHWLLAAVVVLALFGATCYSETLAQQERVEMMRLLAGRCS